MLAAYFDESGTHASAPVICIAGVVGTAIQLSRIELGWCKALQKLGVSTFHASKCYGQHGEFHGKDEDDCLRLVDELSNEIEGKHINILAAALVRADWDRVASPELKRRFHSHYHFCFECVMQQISSWSRDYARNEPVALTFAEHQEYGPRAAEISALYQQSASYGNFGYFGFAKPACVIALQAADLVCYETYQFMSTGDYSRQSFEGRPVLKKLEKQLHERSMFYNAENIPQLNALDPIHELASRKKDSGW